MDNLSNILTSLVKENPELESIKEHVFESGRTLHKIAKAYSEEKTPHKKALETFHLRMEKMESDLRPMSAKTQINYYKVLSKAVEKFPKDMCGIIDQHFPRAKKL